SPRTTDCSITSGTTTTGCPRSVRSSAPRRRTTSPAAMPPPSSLRHWVVRPCRGVRRRQPSTQGRLPEVPVALLGVLAESMRRTCRASPRRAALVGTGGQVSASPAEAQVDQTARVDQADLAVLLPTRRDRAASVSPASPPGGAVSRADPAPG